MGQEVLEDRLEMMGVVDMGFNCAHIPQRYGTEEVSVHDAVESIRGGNRREVRVWINRDRLYHVM